MGLIKLAWVLHLFLTLACLRTQCFAASNVSVNLVKTPLSTSRRNNAKFVFEVLEGKDVCRNCTMKCKLDHLNSSNCETKQVSYVGLQDGDHMFEVCINGYHGVRCATYNWTIDSVHPTAYVTAASPFTYAPNVAVDIFFTEPCTLGGGFGCASVNSCNLLVYGPGQVIPSSLKIQEPDLKFSLLVSLSTSVQYGRVVLVMDKNFCTDSAGNSFTRTKNSSFLVHFEPVLNSTKEIQRFIHTNQGLLHPLYGKSRGNRRFIFLVKDVPDVAVVTISVESSSIISRQGTPVSPISPVTFLYDSRRPSVKLSTTSNMRTKEDTVPFLIQFSDPVFYFNSSSLTISGGHFQSFRAISQSVYSVDIHADENLVSICVLENTTRDVAGNSNLASNMLYVRHYAVPLVSYMVSAFATAVFALTSLAAGLLTVATASLHSIKRSSRSSSLADPARILFRTACHIQVFALSRWLAVTLPVEYYEFTRGLQWSIPYLSLPWEGEYVRSVMVDSSPRSMPHSEFSTTYEPRLFANPRSGEAKLDIAPSIAGLPLTPMEYTSFFVSQNLKPEAEYITDLNDSNGWREFERNMFWLAVFGGSLLLLHGLILILLKWKRNSEEKKYSGALVLPRFQIFLTILALPCICQASVFLIKGGETWQEIVGILLLGVLCFLLVVLLLFLSVGITMGKLLQYKEVHQEGQKFHWYQEIIRVTLGPGKRGQWTWKNQSNSVYLTMLGPLFEDLRGPPKYMLSQFVGGSHIRGDRIIASDDENEDAEAPLIQKLFGILRIYYTLLESVKRVAIGIVAGLYSANNTSSTPTLVLLCITSFQLFFLVLKKPFIKKRVQLVEIISVLCEVGIFATCLILIQREFSFGCETRIGIFMILLFLIGFTSQIISEWHALYKQIYRLGSGDKRFVSGLKTTLFGLLVIFIPRDLLKKLEVQLQNGETGDPVSSTDQNRSSGSRKSSGGSADKPWLKRLSELAKSSFSKDGSGTSKDPSTSRFFWSGKRSGSSSLASSADFKSRSKTMYRDLEDIFSSR